MSKGKIARSAPDALKILWAENLFTKALNFEEIKKKLGDRGYNFLDNALAMALVRSKFLTRKGTKGDHSYVQRYPFVEENENGN